MRRMITNMELMTRREARKLHLRSTIIDISIFIIVFLFVIFFFRKYQFPTIDGESMSPTYHNGDKVMAVITSDVNVGDVAVLWSDTLDEYIVKRVVGTAGDHIVIEDGALYRNDTKVYESYIAEQGWAEPGVRYDVIVPAGYVYVLGDNRNGSTDSRVLGVISVDDVRMRIVSTTNWINTILNPSPH